MSAGPGITPRFGGDQLLECIPYRRGLIAGLLATAADAADTAAKEARSIQLLQRGLDRRPRDTRRFADSRDASIAEGSCLGGGEEPSLPLIEAGQDCSELPFQFLIVGHSAMMVEYREL